MIVNVLVNSGKTRHRIFLIISLALLASGGAAAQSATDRALARAYTSIAGGLTARDAAVRGLLSAAIEFDPGYSDPRYLRAEIDIAADDPVSLVDVGEELAKAIDSGDWSMYRADDARLLLARVYDSLMRYADVLDVLGAISPRSRTHPDWYRLSGRAHLFLGDQRTAEGIVDEGLKRFPDSLELKLLGVRFSPRLQRFYTAAALDSRREPPVEPLLRGLILAAGDSETVGKLIDRYKSLGFSHPSVDVTAYLSGAQMNEGIAPIPEDILSEQALSDRDLFEAIEGIYADAGRRDELEEFLARRTFEVLEDINDDGIEEGVYRLAEGIMRDYRRDADQDGITDLRITFLSGSVPLSPARAEFVSAEAVRTVHYRAYPEVSRLIIEDADGTATYSFSPGSYDLDAIRAQSVPPEVTVKGALIFDRKMLAELSSGYTLVAAGSRLERSAGETRAKTDNGVNVRAWSRDGEDIVERDIDGDGIAEIRETWAESALVSVELDQEGNGVWEYTIYPRRNLEVWDFDQDGIADHTRRRDE